MYIYGVLTRIQVAGVMIQDLLFQAGGNAKTRFTTVRQLRRLDYFHFEIVDVAAMLLEGALRDCRGRG